MNIQEITALRRAGRLAEAMEAATAEYESNANKYTAGALFWCLNEQYKQQSGDEAAATYARMSELYSQYGEGDEIMGRAIAYGQKRQDPLYGQLQEAAERAKGGDVTAIIPLEQAFAAGDIADSLHPQLAWLVYHTLKHTAASDAHRRKQLLALYLKLNVERPSTLHSLMLSEAVKVEQDVPLQFRIRDFSRLWGLENLRDEDWQQYTTKDGNVLPSLVEKLIGVYAKELKTDGVAPADDFADVVDRALATFKNNQNMPYFKATVLKAQGRPQEAIHYYKQLIMRFPAKFYLWDQLAELADDPEVKIALLCKAVNTGDDEQFIGGTRLRLAAALADRGLLANAKSETERYRATYEHRGWRLRGEFYTVASRIPVDLDAADNATLYANYFPIAEQYVYSDLPTIYAVKVNDRQQDDRNHPGRKYLQWTLKSDQQTYYLKKPRKYGLDTRAANGTLFELKAHDGRVVWIKAAASVPQLDWLKALSGTVARRQDRNGRAYAIIQGVYVADSILGNTPDGATIQVLACRQPDGRWKAVSAIK